MSTKSYKVTCGADQRVEADDSTARQQAEQLIQREPLRQLPAPERLRLPAAGQRPDPRMRTLRVRAGGQAAPDGGEKSGQPHRPSARGARSAARAVHELRAPGRLQPPQARRRGLDVRGVLLTLAPEAGGTGTSRAPAARPALLLAAGPCKKGVQGSRVRVHGQHDQKPTRTPLFPNARRIPGKWAFSLWERLSSRDDR